MTDATLDQRCVAVIEQAWYGLMQCEHKNHHPGPHRATRGDNAYTWVNEAGRGQTPIVLNLSTTIADVTEEAIFEWVRREVARMFPGRTVARLSIWVRDNHGSQAGNACTSSDVDVEVSL